MKGLEQIANLGVGKFQLNSLQHTYKCPKCGEETMSVPLHWGIYGGDMGCSIKMTSFVDPAPLPAPLGGAAVAPPGGAAVAPLGAAVAPAKFTKKVTPWLSVEKFVVHELKPHEGFEMVRCSSVEVEVIATAVPPPR